ncbi:hypothetical protein V8E53_010876 [Lactarius tabidus]
MADHQVPSQQTNTISAIAYPRPTLNQLQGQNPHVASNHQEGVYWDDIAQPVGNVAMQYPSHVEEPNYNYDAAHYHPPPPPIPQVAYVRMYQDDRVAEPVPAQAQPFAPGVQENYDGYGAHFPAADPREAFPGVQPHPPPLADMPPAANGLRNLVGRFLNNPGTLINMLRIEPGPGGRFEVWIALELADDF